VRKDNYLQINLTANNYISSKNRAQKKKEEHFQMLKLQRQNSSQSRILYSVKLSLKIEGEINIFSSNKAERVLLTRHPRKMKSKGRNEIQAGKVIK
jgi:hypothetical protein